MENHANTVIKMVAGLVSRVTLNMQTVNAMTYLRAVLVNLRTLDYVLLVGVAGA